MTKIKDVTLALFQLVGDPQSEISNYPELIEIAEKWLDNDFIKMDLVATYNDYLKETAKLNEEPLPLIGHIVYFLENPFIIDDDSELLGIKEFADMIGWDKARLSTKYSRQREGKKVRPLLPEPIEILAATPVWTKAQVMSYKRKLDSKSL